MTNEDFEQGAISLRLRRKLPPCEQVRATTSRLLLGVHLDQATHVDQRRAGKHHQGQFWPGELTLIPAGMDCECSTDGPAAFLHMEIDEATLARKTVWSGTKFQFQDALLRDLALAALRKARSGDPAARLQVESLGTLVLARLRLHDGGREPPPPASLGQATLARVLELMRARLDAPPSLAELGDLADVGPDQFGRLFRATTGLTPYRCFQWLRMTEARRRLTMPDARVLDVAVSLGFSNPSHFAAAFRKVMGLNPRAFLA
ncbi:hypothetical protein CXZ10_06300 [Pleomorphomonas diazotrophica]|uniref:HTH araC/xylS-type domain-containing protein n=1 Tax=Pleomorphomonas diazotrophica TaxID=1166257 RepID=A0A1I4Q495_9HYPH|nr:AraC family transcriptional regulator [Pleomorphomonas diazotrophica]PKR90949.1 hypothetical protein CXZ10_06300 [Pleomorphomonas diazotrophica]SFM34854.1 AraC family transcriptional regulator [Pleomorphomonas diazotrophica]